MTSPGLRLVFFLRRLFYLGGHFLGDRDKNESPDYKPPPLGNFSPQEPTEVFLSCMTRCPLGSCALRSSHRKNAHTTWCPLCVTHCPLCLITCDPRGSSHQTGACMTHCPLGSQARSHMTRCHTTRCTLCTTHCPLCSSARNGSSHQTRACNEKRSCSPQARAPMEKRGSPHVRAPMEKRHNNHPHETAAEE